MTASAGANFGRYQLLDTLGSGGFATVYRAFDPALARRVAIKALFADLAITDDHRRRFLAEARALATLNHPNIVTVFDVGEADGRPFFAVELLEGRTVSQLTAGGHGLPLQRACLILADVAAALDEVHRAGLVHRDVKGANVVVMYSGRAKLMDFGIALAAGVTRLTQKGYGMGTPEYVSPEQISGYEVGPKADIYSLGVLTYCMLAGHPPFTGDMLHVLYAQANLPPPPLRQFRPDIPAALAAVLDEALAKDAARRPASAGEFVRSLTGTLSTAERAATRGDAAPDQGAAQFIARPDLSRRLPPRPSAETTVAAGDWGETRIGPAPAVLLGAPGVRGLQPVLPRAGELFGLRAAAFALDSVFGFVAFFGLLIILIGLFGKQPDWTVFLSLTVWAGYVWWGNACGRRLAKRIVGVRVVREAPGWRVGLGRFGACFISSTVLCVGFLWPLWDRKGQAWHDKLAGTVVIRDPA